LPTSLLTLTTSPEARKNLRPRKSEEPATRRPKPARTVRDASESGARRVFQVLLPGLRNWRPRVHPRKSPVKCTKMHKGKNHRSYRTRRITPTNNSHLDKIGFDPQTLAQPPVLCTKELRPETKSMKIENPSLGAVPDLSLKSLREFVFPLRRPGPVTRNKKRPETRSQEPRSPSFGTPSVGSLRPIACPFPSRATIARGFAQARESPPPASPSHNPNQKQPPIGFEPQKKHPVHPRTAPRDLSSESMHS